MSRIDELKQRAAQGDVNAQFDLGWIYLTAKEGVTQDTDISIKYLEMAAAQGDMDATTCLSSVYDDFDIDANKSMYWAKKAAMMSTTGEEIVDYAFRLIEGRLVPQDYTAARELLLKAVALGKQRAREMFAKIEKL